MSMINDIIAAYTSLVTNDDGAVQLLQGEGEQQDNDSTPEATPDMAVMMPYGFSHNAPVGSDVIAVQVEGRSEQTVIAVQHREHRPKQLSIGAVCLHILSGKILVYLDPADETLHLGLKGATDFVPLASKVDAEFTRIYDGVANMIFTPVPHDGGAAAVAAVKTAFSTAASAKQPTGSEVVRCV